MLLEKYAKKSEEILNEIKQMEAEIQAAHQVRHIITLLELSSHFVRIDLVRQPFRSCIRHLNSTLQSFLSIII